MFPQHIFGNDDGDDKTIEDFQFRKSKAHAQRDAYRTFMSDNFSPEYKSQHHETKTCLSINLFTKEYNIQQFEDVIEDGWRITKGKIKKDHDPAHDQVFKDENFDLLEFYDTQNEPEVLVMVPCPEFKALQLFLKAYDLNPLLMLNLRDTSHSCQMMAYVSPRMNKFKLNNEDGLKPPYESQYINLSMRDSLDQSKLRVVKLVISTVNRKIFVFYNHNKTFFEIFTQMKNYFQLTHSKNPEFLKSSV